MINLLLLLINYINMDTYFNYINLDVLYTILDILESEDLLNFIFILNPDTDYKTLCLRKYPDIFKSVSVLPKDVIKSIFNKKYLNFHNENIWKCIFRYNAILSEDEYNHIKSISYLYKVDPNLTKLLSVSKLLPIDDTDEIVSRNLQVLRNCSQCKDENILMLNTMFKNYIIDYDMILKMIGYDFISLYDLQSIYSNAHYIIELSFFNNFPDLIDHIMNNYKVIKSIFEFRKMFDFIITVGKDKITKNIKYCMKKYPGLLECDSTYHHLLYTFLANRNVKLFKYYIKNFLFKNPFTTFSIRNIIEICQYVYQKDPHDEKLLMISYLSKNVPY